MRNHIVGLLISLLASRRSDKALNRTCELLSTSLGVFLIQKEIHFPNESYENLFQILRAISMEEAPLLAMTRMKFSHATTG